jgi:hypothetical protein
MRNKYYILVLSLLLLLVMQNRCSSSLKMNRMYASEWKDNSTFLTIDFFAIKKCEGNYLISYGFEGKENLNSIMLLDSILNEIYFCRVDSTSFEIKLSPGAMELKGLYKEPIKLFYVNKLPKKCDSICLPQREVINK